MIDYAAILTANYAGSQWSLNGDTYDGLEWFDNTPKPTQAELDVAWPDVKKKLVQANEQKVAARSSALLKLAEIGLTADEVNALLS
jgi:cytochrome c